jgi:LPXTG-site transpeptidase (sortase) family protein
MIESNATREKSQAGTIILMTVSGLLILFGIVSAAYLAWPFIARSWQEPEVYYPPLPMSEERDVNEEEVRRPRQLFPELIPIEDHEEGNWIRIPSIGVAVPLVMSQSINDVDVLSTLSSGAALYPNGIIPGRPGNAFIAAHSTGEPWKGKYRFAFIRINELTNNNLIHLDFENTRYTYRIVDTRIINPETTEFIASDGNVPRITLMACWPLWSTKQRMLVTGELANITKLTPQPE